MHRPFKLALVFVIAASTVYGAYGISRTPDATASSGALTGESGDILFANQQRQGTLNVLVGVYDPDTGKTVDISGGHDTSVKELYLSPNRNLVAVTMQPAQQEGEVTTYLTDLNGELVTQPKAVSFVAWAPDSSAAFLFLSGRQGPEGRVIYKLDMTGKYSKEAFPSGTISISINPVTGDVLYALTSQGTDASQIFLRPTEGEDRMLIDIPNHTLTWMRWSPDGSRFSFLANDLSNKSEQPGLYVANAIGSEYARVDDALWNYPPTWSPTGSSLAYASPTEDGAQVKELLGSEEIVVVASFPRKYTYQPAYTRSGELLFISDESGSQEVWIRTDGKLQKLTDTSVNKQYPISL